jgi:membrane complex biogenesis BtpA family protein
METRETFIERFGHRAVFGMIHLAALPGSPRYGGSMQQVIDAAVFDARAIARGGADGLVFENWGDRPFFKSGVAAETIAALTRVVTIVRGELSLPTGINVLRNDARSAIGIAAATDAAFIRVNVHVGAMLTDQGVIEGQAADTLRARAVLAPDVAIFADHLVKHAVPLAPLDARQLAKDLRLRGMADALIVTGMETGSAPLAARFAELRDAVDAPLIVGSGVTVENAAEYGDADGAIVGTSIKRGGDVDAPVDVSRVERLVTAFKS